MSSLVPSGANTAAVSVSTPSREGRVRGDRRRAAGLEPGEHAPLGRRGQARRRVVDRGDALRQRSGCVGADLERQRALRGRGGPCADVEELGCLTEPPESLESRGGQHEPVHAAVIVGVVEAPQPGVDVAADADDLEIGSGREQLRAPARRPGAHARARGQPRQGHAVARREGVAGVGAHRDGRETDAVGRRRRQVLEGVHDEVDLAGQERVAQCRDEDAGAAERCERAPRSGRPPT